MHPRMMEIRKSLELPSVEQKAWSYFTERQRKVFISLSGLSEYESLLVDSKFDSFPETYKNRLRKTLRQVGQKAQEFAA